MDTLLLVDYDITVQYYLYRYPYKYIDQCKDTYCKGRVGTMHTGKLKERMPNIAGIYGIVRSETECVASRRRRMPQLVSPAVSRTVSVGG
jgi:hypothetical protein